MLFWGQFGSPLPLPTPVHTVVGRPIAVERLAQASAHGSAR